MPAGAGQNEVKNLTAKYGRGHLYLIDNIKQGDPSAGGALTLYANSINSNRQSRQWVRAVQWIENVLFGLGRHYIDDILISRISRDTSGNLGVAEELTRNIPRPTNDLLSSYVETNISLLTENRPIPRVTAKSDDLVDKRSAELSELTLEYLWEELDLAEKHREIARLLLYTGVCFLETVYDPLEPRYMMVPATKTEATTPIAGGIEAPVPREVMDIDPVTLQPKLTGEVEYGDITSKVVSGFEIHLPIEHWWNGDDMGWIMREYYISTDALRDKYQNTKVKHIVTKKNGYFPERIDDVEPINVQNLPLWWWERLSDTVEGPGPTLYVGTPEQWDDYTVVRIFDRKPNPLWPRGRTVITAGDQVIYDSPKKVGARAFDPRWPKRWHPYTRYRWEGQLGSVYGRSLVSKLLPKLKRVNAIDTTMIMWRRTVPIASWILPKGSSPVEDLHSGQPGSYITYDPRRTQQMEPKPVYPPSYPSAALQERETQLAEMERIAGTEDILRGERPRGVNSAAMLDTLRKQALASRSPILQAWDESLQATAKGLLQETMRHIGEDARYKERINILAREKASSFTIDAFAGANLSDNVQVRIDTASVAMVSREAKQTRALEVMQYAQGLMMLPTPLRSKIIADLGWPDSLAPQGADINRARAMIQYIKGRRFELAVPMPEDDPYVLHELLVAEMKAENFIDLDNEVQIKFFEMINLYRQEIEKIEQAKIQFQQAMAAAGQGGEGGN
jgi:hypothetical protein